MDACLTESHKESKLDHLVIPEVIHITSLAFLYQILALQY